MSTRTLDGLDGPVELPRSNGELVFTKPWESRAFGIAVALCDEGLLEWDAFRDELISEIARGDARGGQGQPAVDDYYLRWLVALERLLERRRLVAPADVRRRADHLRRLDDHSH